MIRRSLPAIASIALLTSAPALGGFYSSHSGFTAGAPDNPIARSAIATFESRVVSYDPAPGVGPNFRSYATGFASLGDLYSPVPRGTTNTPFDRRYRPAVGTEPSSFHAGSAVNAPFGGDVFDPDDTYGFIGIDAPGSITLGFDPDLVLFDGDGADFAVFENGFATGGPTSLFAELAYVEVSSNGVDFARFASISTNPQQPGAYAGYDVTNIYNLAGKHATNWGTPFDLAQLATDTLVLSGRLDLAAVRFVRLVDVVGSGALLDAAGNVIPGIARDSLGNPIHDNWVTFDSGGFDYLGLPTGAVGVLNARVVPEPSAWALSLAGLGLVAAARRRAARRQARARGCSPA